MKIVVLIFAFVFCMTSISTVFASDCTGKMTCKYASQSNDENGEDGKSTKQSHQCVCCGMQQLKNLGSASVVPSLTEMEAAFFFPTNQFHDSRATAPLLEPPAA